MKNFIDKIVIFCVFILGLSLFSCSHPKIKEFKCRLNLKECSLKNDSVDFCINSISICDYRRKSNIHLSDADPWFELNLSIKNKTNKTILFKGEDYGSKNISNFAGILTSKKDTAFFITDRNEYFYLNPFDTITIQLYSFLFKSLMNYDEFINNTNFMLDLLQEMEFYYIPDEKINISSNSDTVMLHRVYCLEINKNTTFFSKIYRLDY